jgi:glyoxylase-like metal-dependent hydrolase (beta-lactamase superfamily II)
MPRIEQLHLADLVLPEGHPEARRRPRAIVFGFAIDHPDGVIVVDTGVGRGNAFIDEAYRPRVLDVGDALTAVGLDPAGVTAIVNSHLHFDHCGQNPTYYGSDLPLYVQADEVAAASEPLYTVDEWATVPDRQLRALRGDEQLADGVRVLTTPGHTRGHQSVIVEAGGEVVVIAAQAVWDIAEFEDVEATESNADAELRDAALGSIRRLKALEPSIAYFSHDARVYRRDRRDRA